MRAFGSPPRGKGQLEPPSLPRRAVLHVSYLTGADLRVDHHVAGLFMPPFEKAERAPLVRLTIGVHHSHPDRVAFSGVPGIKIDIDQAVRRIEDEIGVEGEAETFIRGSQ